MRYENLEKNSYFLDKTYTLGLILYELTFGQNLFTHDCLETLIMIKTSFKEIIYPKYMDIGFNEPLKTFIESCIFMKF